MFSYTGLTRPQVDYLREVRHVYIFHTGRMNISALALKDIDYVAESVTEAVKMA